MMKYTTLKNDLLSILHSSDYNFILKLYDEDGNTTIKSDETKWIYITNEKIMIELADDDNPLINIWKDNSNLSNDFEKIIQRIRELSVLNGVSVQIHLFDDLNRRKIYNIIKNGIETKKEDDMNESINYDVTKTLYELSTTLSNTNRSSDLYISESLRNKNKLSFMNDMISSILCLEGLNSKKIKSLLTKTLLEKKFDKIRNIVKHFESKCNQEYKKLYENISNINNVSNFMKQRYLKNIVSKNTPHTIMVLENVKAYIIKTKNDKDNLSRAYNHLISVSDNAKTGTDILLAIKRNNICETYSVSKNDLLDMWLSKSIDSKIVPSKLLVFENVDGDTKTFNMDIVSSINILADSFNINGFTNNSLTKSIVNETLKLNALSDLIENHSYNIGVKKLSKTIKSLYNECLNSLSINNYKTVLSESSDMNINYSHALENIESMVGFKHPSLKYIAIKETLENEKKRQNILSEQKNDTIILSNGLKLTLNANKALNISKSIINTGLISKKTITESLDTKNMAKEMYLHVSSTDPQINDIIKDSLFYIINTPKMDKTKRDYIYALKKYVI